MFSINYPLYLASKSPRRRKLLKQLGLKFNAFTVNLNEEILDGEHPIRTVKRLSLEKLELAGQKVNDGIIITADTIVVLDKSIIGKPENKKDAVAILNKLSGKTHNVYTGFAIYNSTNKKQIVGYEKTAVTFNDLSREQIDSYVKTGSPMDKAGAYGIQDDFGAVFVKKVNGCFYNVVGLPLSKIYTNLLRII